MPFWKKKIEKMDKSKKPHIKSPPQFTNADESRMRALQRERANDKHVLRLEAFSCQPGYFRQEIIDSLKSHSFYESFFEAEKGMPESKELYDLFIKEREWRNHKGELSRMDYGHHRSHSRDREEQAKSQYQFILDASITIEDLEKTHIEAVIEEELLDTNGVRSGKD